MPRRFGLTAPELRQLDEVRIELEVRAALLTAARPATGEACAALYGTPDGPQLTVGAWRPLPNADPGDCLTISVADLLEGGCTSPPGRLVGLFHSHPRSPAVPSDLDRLAIARLPFVWAIAGPGDRPETALRFFAWSGAGLRELRESSVRPRLGAGPAHGPGGMRRDSKDADAPAGVVGPGSQEDTAATLGKLASLHDEGPLPDEEDTAKRIEAIARP